MLKHIKLLLLLNNIQGWMLLSQLKARLCFVSCTQTIYVFTWFFCSDVKNWENCWTLLEYNFSFFLKFFFQNIFSFKETNLKIFNTFNLVLVFIGRFVLWFLWIFIRKFFQNFVNVEVFSLLPFNLELKNIFNCLSKNIK